jgi:hypothetical protein
LYDLTMLECRRLLYDDLPPRQPIAAGAETRPRLDHAARETLPLAKKVALIDSPTGFFEIPLQTDAKGLSFAVFAGVQTAPNQYTLVTLQNKIVQVRSPEVFLTAIFPAISDMEH